MRRSRSPSMESGVGPQMSSTRHRVPGKYSSRPLIMIRQPQNSELGFIRPLSRSETVMDPQASTIQPSSPRYIASKLKTR